MLSKDETPKRMRFIAIALMFVVWGAPCNAQGDKALDSIMRSMVTHQKVDGEFLQMAIELRDLHDPKVDAIVTPHMNAINKLWGFSQPEKPR